MNVISYTRGPTLAKLLYAGAQVTPTPNKTTQTAEPSKSIDLSSADNIQISDAAKAASNKLLSDKGSSTSSLKSRIDKLFQEAKDAGTFITFDSSKGGVWMDLSSFDDDELGKIALDKDHEFSTDLQKHARGALGTRVKVSLEPFESAVSSGDMRAHVSAIKLLYKQMSPDTLSALGWTTDMLKAGENILEKQTGLFGKLNMEAVLSGLSNAAQKGGIGFSLSGVKNGSLSEKV